MLADAAHWSGVAASARGELTADRAAMSNAAKIAGFRRVAARPGGRLEVS